jgi:hypothetical protein
MDGTASDIFGILGKLLDKMKPDIFYGSDHPIIMYIKPALSSRHFAGATFLAS